MVTVISYPTNTINESINIDDTLNSYELIKYVWVEMSEADPTDTHIEIVFNGETITLFLTEECRFTPIDIFFINKEGSEQVITFFKKKTDSMTTNSEVFESDRGQPLEGNHQFVRYNVNARSSFVVNSGFVDESMNETFKQLELSEKVWIFENSVFTPLNKRDGSIEFKTRQNDRLINYEVQFEFAFNEINNV